MQTLSIGSIINQYDFNLAYAKALVEDVSKTQMTSIPSPGLVNHPAFTLGHLVAGSEDLLRDLGGIFEMPENWAELFVRKGPGDPRLPDPDQSKYPPKQALINTLDQLHNIVKIRIESMGENDLEKPVQWRFSQYMPTTYDLILFMCVNHESMHLGQLAAWRRAMGLKSALAVL